ncbi:type IX secretion system plug protein domain-containing protein [Nonlabens ulvanivorans]|uniref:type IX secretion system plug protein n=1 Tax=Nonlabens ulvanivorans TaxID=906888 RepID=UPI003296AA59
MKSFFILVFTTLSVVFIAQSQTLEDLVNDPDYIKSVTFNKEPEYMLPVFQMGETVALEFDDVIGDEADYYYQFEHYDYNWQPSRLFKNEFLDGIDDMRVFDYRNSFTTLQSFSHYTLSIPNQFTRGFKVSGNYMIHIYNDNRELVFSRKFMIMEEKAQVGVEIKRARDIKYINTQQRVQYTVDSQEINFINPADNLKTVIIQNSDIQTALYDIKPQFNLGNRQEYRYDTETSFWAGNEYLNFENRDFRSPNQNIDYVRKKDLYEAYLFVHKPRYGNEYTFFPDINGNYLVTTLDNEDNAVQAEYVNVHFSLLPAFNLPPDASIYVMGNYNAFQLQPENQLIYNEKRGMYEATILLKQGFYNYRYTVVYDNGEQDPGFISGNLWQTENIYTVLAYYREPGGRYDRLIGQGAGSSEDIRN